MKLHHLTLLIISLLVALTSCHKSTEIELTYNVEINESLNDVADIEMVYTDFEGTLHRDKINNCFWEKTLSTPQPPVASMLRIEAHRNANVIDDEPIYLEMKISTSATRYLDGEAMESVRYKDIISSSTEGSEEVVEALYDFHVERDYVITSDPRSCIVLTEHKIVGD